MTSFSLRVKYWVYAVRCKTTGYVKIGVTSDPRKRLMALRSELPVDTTVERIARGTPADEQTIHLMLAPRRVRGEWFDVPPDVIEALFVEDVSHEFFVPTERVSHRVQPMKTRHIRVAGAHLLDACRRWWERPQDWPPGFAEHIQATAPRKRSA